MKSVDERRTESSTATTVASHPPGTCVCAGVLVRLCRRTCAGTELEQPIPNVICVKWAGLRVVLAGNHSVQWKQLVSSTSGTLGGAPFHRVPGSRYSARFAGRGPAGSALPRT